MIGTQYLWAQEPCLAQNLTVLVVEEIEMEQISVSGREELSESTYTFNILADYAKCI